MVKRIANAFMAKNPDVQVNHLVIPGAEMDAKILTGVAADDPPDVAMIWGAQRVYSLADQGALYPLEDALQGEQLTRFREFVHPPIWELGRYQGKVYAIPQWVQSYCHIWNKDYVQQAGLDAERGPRTTDELFDWAMKLTRRRSDGTIDVLGYYSSWMQLNMSIFGGSFYDERRTRSRWTTSRTWTPSTTSCATPRSTTPRSWPTTSRSPAGRRRGRSIPSWPGGRR